ncbi:hypothetical protein M5D96_008458, partial [Drosophila gunungcola]
LSLVCLLRLFNDFSINIIISFFHNLKKRCLPS